MIHNKIFQIEYKHSQNIPALLSSSFRTAMVSNITTGDGEYD